MSHDKKKARDQAENVHAANRAIAQEHAGGTAAPPVGQDPTRRPPAPGTAHAIRGYADLAREQEAEQEAERKAKGD